MYLRILFGMTAIALLTFITSPVGYGGGNPLKPGGGFGAKNAGGKGGKVSRDPGERFDALAQGRPFIMLSDLSKGMQVLVNEYAREKGVPFANGQITRDQYLAFSQYFTEKMAGGGFFGKGSRQNPIGQNPIVSSRQNPIVQLAGKMAQPIDFPGIKEPASLPEALALLSKQSGIVFYINVNSLEVDEKGPGGVPWDQEIVLAKQNAVRTDSVLRRMLAQVSRDLDYVLRRDGVEITTRRKKLDEFYRYADHPSRMDLLGAPAPDEEANLRYLPLVQAQFKKTPLQDALDTLTESTGCSVLLDPAAAEKAQPVTATLINVPLDSAVKILANMCGLSVVLRDRALYVTTKENSEVMQKELRGRTSGKTAR